MYKAFFGLKENPFSQTPDIDNFYLSSSMQEALSMLIYGIESRAGFVVVAGEVGTGKTTLSRYLVNYLGNKAAASLIFNPSLSPVQILKAINKDFGLPGGGRSKETLLSEMNAFLLAQNTNGKHAVVIVDESQNLSIDCLEELRMLSNFETAKRKLLQIVLFGQTELKDMLHEKNLRQLNQRISLRCNLKPLTQEEVKQYIDKKLTRETSKTQACFTNTAVDEIYTFTRGIPRLINMICEKALVAAYLEETKVINKKIVQKALEEIRQTDSELEFKENIKTKVVELPLRPRKRFNFYFKMPHLPVKGAFFAGLTVFALVTGSYIFSTGYLDKIIHNSKEADILSVWYDEKEHIYRSNHINNAFAVSVLNMLKENRLIPLVKKDILSIVKEKGLMSGNVILERKDLQKISSNAIILLNRFDLSASKYSIVQDIEDIKDGTITIIDPVAGKIDIDDNDFESMWQGDAVIFWKRINEIDEHDFGDGISLRAIKSIQKILYSAGYYKGTFDGVLGPDTSGALKKFQEKHNIKPDGKLDALTYYWLSETVGEKGKTF